MKRLWEVAEKVADGFVLVLIVTVWYFIQQHEKICHREDKWF